MFLQIIVVKKQPKRSLGLLFLIRTFLFFIFTFASLTAAAALTRVRTADAFSAAALCSDNVNHSTADDKKYRGNSDNIRERNHTSAASLSRAAGRSPSFWRSSRWRRTASTVSVIIKASVIAQPTMGAHTLVYSPTVIRVPKK